MMKPFLIITLLISLLAPVSRLNACPIFPLTPPEKWRSIRTNNLFLVGNAEEQALRQTALWLEFFHSSFARLISRSVMDSAVPTTVIVFKDDASFTNFKPLYQGQPANVAGYFQPGYVVNYIAVSLEPGGRNPLATAFHEYVHLHVQNNFRGIPLWLNEGLAEFYGSIVSESGAAVLGAPQLGYIRLLRSQGVLPFATLFSVNQSSPHYNEQDKSGVFYAQSWAMVHYLMMGDGGRRGQQFKRFLTLSSEGETFEKALQNAFGMSLLTFERGFIEYLRNGDLPSERLNVGMVGPQRPIAMQRSSISEGEANFYLGDLLAHIQRDDTAEKHFRQAISLDSSFLPTYGSLGLLCVRKNRLAEAKKYLERAVVVPQSYLVHYYYAYVLSRDDMTAKRDVRGVPESTTQTMRDHLNRVIKLAPEFADAYYLLAWVNLAAQSDKEQKLDEAADLVKRAQRLAPSRLRYGLLLAEIYSRQGEKEFARQVLEPLARQSTNPSVRADALDLLDALDGKLADSSGRRSNSSRASASAIIQLELQPSATVGSLIAGSNSGAIIRDGRTIDRSAPVPPVEQVMNQFAQAIGDSKALAATSRAAKGTIDLVGVSRGGSVEIYSKPPRRTLTLVRAMPFGEIKLGFNGNSGWTFPERGSKARTAELSGLEWSARISNPLSLRASYSKITLLGRTSIGFREVFLIELQTADGATEKLYLDATTHLPVRVNSASLEIYFDDWRDVDGVKAPFRITQSSAGLTMRVTLQEIKHNVALDDSLFEKPVR
jgi:tetratricopeptide (TPR) repeat protein